MCRARASPCAQIRPHTVHATTRHRDPQVEATTLAPQRPSRCGGMYVVPIPKGAAASSDRVLALVLLVEVAAGALLLEVAVVMLVEVTSIRRSGWQARASGARGLRCEWS